MGNLGNALQQLRDERKQMQSQVEKLDRAISVIESLNGSVTTRNANQPNRIISGRFAAQNGAGTKGEMGEGSRKIAATGASENNYVG
jgi:hypothetical protein